MQRLFVFTTAVFFVIATATDSFGQQAIQRASDPMRRTPGQIVVPQVQRATSPPSSSRPGGSVSPNGQGIQWASDPTRRTTVPVMPQIPPSTFPMVTPSTATAARLHVCTTIDPPSRVLYLAGDTTRLWHNGSTLRVRFLNGDATIQEKVKRYAAEWSNYANIKFAFINTGDSDIRITFSGSGYWSMVGTDARGVPQSKETMCLGGLNASSPDVNVRRVVLHEFGHALGMRHEHQSPAGAIPWNKDAVYKYYADPKNGGWSKAKVDEQIFQKLNQGSTNFSRFDKDSIMIYSIPNALTIGNYEVAWNTVLSAIDKEHIAKIYPKGNTPPSANSPVVKIRIQSARNKQTAQTAIPEFQMINRDLDEGMSGWGWDRSGKSNYIYLFYQKDSNGTPITDIRITSDSVPVPTGFIKIPANLNTFGSGDNIYLCYSISTDKKPITAIAVRDESRPLPSSEGWIRDNTNLNKGGGKRGTNLYLWYTRDIVYY